MTHTLSERIKAQVEKKPIKSANKVAFLALKDEIADALKKGHSIISIWKTLHTEGKILTTYNTFRLHVAKHIPN